MSAAVPYRSVHLPVPRHVEGDAGTAAARDLGPAAPSAGSAYVNPVLDVDGVDHGEPSVLEHCGEYVLYHPAPDGVRAVRSRDLVTWEPVGQVLAPQGWAQAGFRSPEVVREGHGFVMYVVAPAGPGADGRTGHRVGVARAQSPTGPFRLDPEPLLPGEWSTGAYPFTAHDGSRWLFSTVRTDTGTGTVVRRLDAGARPVGDAEPVISPTRHWEGDGVRGAVVLERGGWYHQLYVGGSSGSPAQAVGVARAPVVRGPWRTDDRGPVLVSGHRVTGPGRPAVVVGPDGATPYAVYPASGGGTGRAVHLDRLCWAGDAPRIGTGATLPGHPGEGLLPVPPPPAVDPDVPHRFHRAWVEGGIARVGGVDVVLPVRPSLVTVSTDGATAVVRLDGVVVARVDLDDAPPGVLTTPLAVRGGTVVHAVTTSRLDDEHHHVLDAGTSASWSWGGHRPVTAEVAVRGRATLRLGDVERFVDTVDLNGGTGFAVVVLESPDGADRLTVTAGTDAQVADVVLATRPAPHVP